MTSFDDALWEHLVERHGADRAQMRATTTSRTARRPVVVGITATATGLAAAGVATVLAISSGSASTPAGGPSAGGSGGSAQPSPAVPGGPVKTENTAYILKRVKAKLAQDSQSEIVIDISQYARGDVSSNGSLVNLGRIQGSEYQYTAPDGTVHQRFARYKANGSPRLATIATISPGAIGKYDDVTGTITATSINYVKHTYTRTRRTGAVPSFDGPAPNAKTPNLRSSAAEVRQALQSGHVTQIGTTAVDGTQAIALSVSEQGGGFTLYVDAQTDQPLRLVVPGLAVDDWLPATPDNIAMVEKDSIPAGYTKVTIHRP